MFHHTKDSRRIWAVDNPSGRIPATDAEKYEHQLKWRDPPWAPVEKPKSRNWDGAGGRRVGTLWYEPTATGGVITPAAPQPAPQPQQRAEATEIETTAGHESAHVCLAVTAGCKNVKATVNPSRDETGKLFYGRCEFERADNLSLVDDIAISAAGGIWEQMEFGHFIGGPDTADVERKLDAAGITDAAKRKALIAEAHAHARAVLQANREMVRELSKRLAEEGSYTHQSTVTQTMQVRRVELAMQTRSAAVTTDGETINVCWGSGELVKRASFDGPYMEDLPAANADLTWMNSGKCPLLDSHNNSRVDDVLGVVVADSSFVRDGKGFATIKLGSNAPAGIKEGTLRNISIGYAINSMKRNGEAADGTPIMTITSFRILECSIVGVPADKGAEILRKYPATVMG